MRSFGIPGSIGAIAGSIPAFVLAWNAAYASDCTPSEITIKQSNLMHQQPSGYLLVVGELQNNCSEAVSPQFHITLRDASGKVVMADDAWPSGTTNIPAHSSYAFTVNGADPDVAPLVKSLQIDVVGISKF